MDKRSRLVKSTICSLMHTLGLDNGCFVHWMGWIHLVPKPMLCSPHYLTQNLSVLAFYLVFFSLLFFSQL
jgi:hypothetical protein